MYTLKGSAAEEEVERLARAAAVVAVGGALVADVGQREDRRVDRGARSRSGRLGSADGGA